MELYAAAGAVDRIARRYFLGHSPLFAETAEQLRRAVELAEQLVDLYNDSLGRTRKTKEVDCVALKQRSAEQAIAEVAHTRLSQAETLRTLGDTHAAAVLIQEHL